MAGDTRRIMIEFLGKDVSATSAADKVEQRFGKLGSRLDKVGQAAGKMLAVGAVAGSVALYKMSQSAAADAAAQEKLHTALRNNTLANDASIAKIEEWVTATSLATGVSDDELRPALQRLAETSGSAVKAQEQLQIAMDVSAGTGKSLKTVTEAMAKANNGSLGGLSRLGVKTKDAAGNTVTLDNAMKQMSSTFKGQAAKAAETAEGKSKRLGVAMDELGEQIGTAVLPALQKFTEIGIKVTAWVSNHTTLVGTLVGVLGGLAAALYAVSVGMRIMATATKAWSLITKIAAAAQWLLNVAMSANPIGLVVIAIAALVAGLVIAYKKSETFRKIVNAAFGAVANAAKVAFNWVKEKAMAAFNWIKANWKTLLAILTGPIGIAVLVISRNWDKIKAGAARAVDWIKDKFNGVVGFFRSIPGRISAAASGMWNGILNAFRGMINNIIGLWNRLDFGIPSFNIPGIGKFGGTGDLIPDLPYLAKGGIVTRPTLAVIGEAGPEAVIPLNRAGGMGGGVHVHFHGPVLGGDERAVAKEIARILLVDKRLTGRLPLAGLA